MYFHLTIRVGSIPKDSIHSALCATMDPRTRGYHSNAPTLVIVSDNRRRENTGEKMHCEPRRAYNPRTIYIDRAQGIVQDFSGLDAEQATLNI